MGLHLKILSWALIFILRLHFPPRKSIDKTKIYKTGLILPCAFTTLDKNFNYHEMFALSKLVAKVTPHVTKDKSKYCQLS